MTPSSYRSALGTPSTPKKDSFLSYGAYEELANRSTELFGFIMDLHTENKELKKQVAELLDKVSKMETVLTPAASTEELITRMTQLESAYKQQEEQHEATKKMVEEITARVSVLEAAQPAPAQTLLTKIGELEARHNQSDQSFQEEVAKVRELQLDVKKQVEQQGKTQETSLQLEQHQHQVKVATLQSHLESLQKIQAEMTEKLERNRRAMNARVGGLQTADLQKPLHQVLPPLEGWDGVISSTKIPQVGQVILHFRSKHDRDGFLKQSHKLKGSKLWMAADLTRQQLQVKKMELEKVKEARKMGKWAVYKDGKAIIQEFKKQREGKG